MTKLSQCCVKDQLNRIYKITMTPEFVHGGRLVITHKFSDDETEQKYCDILMSDDLAYCLLDALKKWIEVARFEQEEVTVKLLEKIK